MKYLYKIDSYNYEGSNIVLLFHTKKINKKEFNNMFVEAVLELLLNRRKDFPPLKFFQEGEIINTKDNLRFYTRFGGIFDKVVEIMIELYGFEKASYEQEIDIEELEKIVVKDEDRSEDNILLNEIGNKYWKRKNK